jgi:hypothetical protein
MAWIRGKEFANLLVGYDRSGSWLWKEFGGLKKPERNHVGKETELDGRYQREGNRNQSGDVFQDKMT